MSYRMSIGIAGQGQIRLSGDRAPKRNVLRSQVNRVY